MAEISRGRPLQGTDFILTLLDAELTTSTKEMNPKWKIEVIGRFWLFFGYFWKNDRFFEKEIHSRSLCFYKIGGKNITLR